MLLKSLQGGDALPLRVILASRALSECHTMLVELIVQLAERRELTKHGIEELTGGKWEVVRAESNDMKLRSVSPDAFMALLESARDAFVQHPQLAVKFLRSIGLLDDENRLSAQFGGTYNRRD